MRPISGPTENGAIGSRADPTATPEVSSGVACVILAAGEGRRAGGPKAFLSVPDPRTGQEEWFLPRVARVAREGGASPVVAVIRPADRDLARAIAPEGIGMVENPCPERGMLSSLRCGVEALPREVSGVLVFPVDHVAVLPSTVAMLIGAFRREGAFWAPVWEGRPGHPIVLPAWLARQVPAEDLPGGLAAWLRRQGVGRREVAVRDRGVLQNCNHGPGLPER